VDVGRIAVVLSVPEVEVPAGSCSFRVQQATADGDTWSFGHSIPRAETWPDRVYDAHAWWPVFRWLPDLR